MWPQERRPNLRAAGNVLLLRLTLPLVLLLGYYFDDFHSNLIKQPLQRDLSGPSWWPWRENPPGNPCAKYETRLGKAMRRVWLVSFPCSGNTWLRYLLEGASGIFTGSVYKEKPLYEAGFLGEMKDVESGRTLVQKTHGVMFNSMYPHDLLERHAATDPARPAILLLRDPARAITSSWHLLHLSGKEKHTAQVDQSTYNTTGFRIYVEEATSLWEELATDRLLWGAGPLHVLHYEHLLADPVRHLRECLHFLGVPVDEERLRCVTTHLAGPFKSNRTLSVDPFTSSERRRMNSAVRRVTRLHSLLGHPLPPYSQEV